MGFLEGAHPLLVGLGQTPCNTGVAEGAVESDALLVQLEVVEGGGPCKVDEEDAKVEALAGRRVYPINAPNDVHVPCPAQPLPVLAVPPVVVNNVGVLGVEGATKEGQLGSVGLVWNTALHS